MLRKNIEYVENIKRFGIRPGLERMKKIMQVLGNPQKSFRSIHITGTNGKGSTTTLTSQILKEAGYKVGLYLSPYVNKFNERIQINNKMITNRELDILITKVRIKLTKNNINATFFEFITAAAFLYFAEKDIDLAVIEVGMGGGLDATNITNSIISVITNISLDHEKYLGNTKEKIAKEKAGIIKKDQIFITSEEDKEIRNIFWNICKKNNTKPIYVFDIIKARQLKQDFKYQEFSTRGILNENFNLSLLGPHQIKNALTAIVIAHELKKLGKKIALPDIKRALERTKIPGRMEIISKKPLIIIDGAHNPHGITALARFISRIKNTKTLIIASSDDKNSKEMLKIISPYFQNIIVTKGKFKPKDPRIVAKEAMTYTNNVFVFEEIDKAIKKAKEITKSNEVILITGSLYMIGGAIKILKKD